MPAHINAACNNSMSIYPRQVVKPLRSLLVRIPNKDWWSEISGGGGGGVNSKDQETLGYQVSKHLMPRLRKCAWIIDSAAQSNQTNFCSKTSSYFVCYHFPS